jgi:hypothetical protein
LAFHLLKIVIAQIGTREYYAEARILQPQGLLAAFLTWFGVLVSALAVSAAELLGENTGHFDRNMDDIFTLAGTNDDLCSKST